MMTAPTKNQLGHRSVIVACHLFNDRFIQECPVSQGGPGLHGNTAVIYHGFGLSSLYAHMSDSTLKVGDEIESGDIIGYTGSSGWAFGDHLHLEILVQGHAVSVQEWSNPKWVQESINAVFEQARARLLEQNMLRGQAK